MANEAKRVIHGTTTTLEASGASISNAAIGQANDATLDLTSYTSPAGYPHVRFVLLVTYSVSPNENSVIELIAREMDVDSTNDTIAPTATFREKRVGQFIVDDTTSAQYIVCDVFDAPPKADYYLYNDTGQTVPATWTLKATPFTFGPV